MNRARLSNSADAGRMRSCARLLLLAAAVWLSNAGAAAAERLDEIRARGHLIVGVKGDYHPSATRRFRESGGLRRRCGARSSGAIGCRPVDAGHECESPPEARARRNRRGGRDVGRQPSRRTGYHDEPQYYGDGANVLMRMDSGITTWEGLRGRTLCSVQGSLWNRPASERLLVETVSLNSTREAALALRNGHCVGWLYDEVNLLSALAGGGWDGFGVTLPTRFVAPWAIAIRKEEAGKRLDRLLGDTIASWHRDGFLQELEKKWKLPPSPYLRRAREVWQQKDETGNFVCRRDDSGNWPLECRERALVTGSQLGGLAAISMAFKESTGLDLSPVYDPDRSVFLYGLFLTIALSSRPLWSVRPGRLVRWVCIVGSPSSPVLHAFLRRARMTPPVVELYVVSLASEAFVRVRVYARRVFVARGAIALRRGNNAVSFSLAADVAARDGGSLGFSLGEFRRAFDLCQAAIAGNSINIVKATGMASTLALPELVHSSTAIIAEKGNDGVMMNLLLLCYFGLVFCTIWVLRGWERRAQHS